MPLINCEVELVLTWSASYVIIYTDVANQVHTFTIKETILYVPVVTLSTQENAKLLAQLKSGFKRTINWTKFLLKPELLALDPNLNHLIVPRFQVVNRLSVLAFEGDAQRTSNKRYCIPNVEIKDFNDQPIRNNKVTYENIAKLATGQGDDNTTGFLLDYIYFKNYYRMIVVYLSKQQALDADPKAGRTRIYFILEEAKETLFEFSQGTVKVL